MLKIYLLRHAESTANEQKSFSGSDLNPQLSEKGLSQLDKISSLFKNKKISGVYCSPLSRSIQTAKFISDSLNLKLVLDPRLSELKIGDWIHGTENPLVKWMNYYNEEKSKGIPRKNIRPPKGENSWDHMKRLASFLEEIKKIEGELIVIAHSGTNKVLLGMITGKDPDEFYTLPQENGCLNELYFDGKTWEVTKINDTSHL